MKTVPNTPLGWAWFVEQVKSMIDYPLDADLYSIMMREYYILGKSPEQFVNREK
jgi:hypothetical protein